MPDIEGFQEVISRLKSLDEKTEKQIFRVALKAGAEVVLPAAVALSPRRTGTMVSNLRIRNGGSRKGLVRMTVGASAKDYTGDAFYTPFVLWGHKVGKRPRKSLLRIRPDADTRATTKPNDFIKAAFEQTAEAALNAVETTMARQVELIASGSTP